MRVEPPRIPPSLLSGFWLLAVVTVALGWLTVRQAWGLTPTPTRTPVNPHQYSVSDAAGATTTPTRTPTGATPSRTPTHPPPTVTPTPRRLTPRAHSESDPPQQATPRLGCCTCPESNSCPPDEDGQCPDGCTFVAGGVCAVVPVPTP